METIASLLKKSIAFLNEKGFDETRRTAELLLAHALQCSRIDLYLRFDRPLGDSELQTYREYIRRRLHHEPTQYIIGKTEFYGIELSVTPGVLIPRPETEHLVSAALDVLKNNPECSNGPVLDIGTGSGAIPIALCTQHGTVSCTAIDISPEALAVASDNATLYQVHDRIAFSQSDILASDDIPGVPYSIVVSNPPYISQEEYGTLEPELTKYEPEVALNDGSDGYTFYRRIAERSSELLCTKGNLLVEIGYGQAQSIRQIFAEANLQIIETTRDYSGIERVIHAIRK